MAGTLHGHDCTGGRSVVVGQNDRRVRHHSLFPVVVSDLMTANPRKIAGDGFTAWFMHAQRHTCHAGGHSHRDVILRRTQTARQDDQIRPCG